jgi:hypothetical protein
VLIAPASQSFFLPLLSEIFPNKHPACQGSISMCASQDKWVGLSAKIDLIKFEKDEPLSTWLTVRTLLVV